MQMFVQKGGLTLIIEEAQPKLSSEPFPVKAAESNDDDLAEALADESQRAIDAIRAFLEVMESNVAAFALELDCDSLKPPRFIGSEQAKRTLERIKPENIREGDLKLLGDFMVSFPLADLSSMQL